MLSRFILWSVLAGIALTAGLVAYRQGTLGAWNHWITEWVSGEAADYSDVRFRVDLVDQINHARQAEKMTPLKVDAELETWLSGVLPSMALDDVNQVVHKVKETLPRYLQISVCTASAPTRAALLEQLHDFSLKTGLEMTHLACGIRPATGGLVYQALLVVGQRLEDFSPEIISATRGETYFSVCPHCKHPHIVRISLQQHSLGLECPDCRRTYAVVAADKDGQYRYVNEFLTGYAPPAVFSKGHSRVHELFTIWSAVHANCVYTRDPGEKLNVTDSWQSSLQTQQAGKGDCEDSAIFLCDWLLSRGFQARVVLGRYGDLGGHAWVVVRMEDKEYLLESTEGRPDPSNPPLVSRVGSRYVPEVMFDRYALYVRTVPGQAWKGDYWSSKFWTRVEPRSLKSRIEGRQTGETRLHAPESSAKVARTSRQNPAGAPFLELGDIPEGSPVWQMPLSQGQEKPEATARP